MLRHPKASFAMLAISTGATLLLGGGPASAAPTPTPDPSCRVPSLTVTPTQGTPGAPVVVKGQNFGGCPAKGSTKKPAATITVKVVFTEKKHGTALVSVVTKADHSFTTTVHVPATGATPGQAVFGAGGMDPVTGLSYFASAPFTIPGATTPTPTPTASPSVSPTAPGGGAPTAVPAGNGGQAGTTSSSTIEEQAALGLAGLALLAAGGLGLRRRRAGTHHH